MAPSGRKGRGKRNNTESLFTAAAQESTHSDREAVFESLFRTMPRASTVWRIVRDKKGAPKDLVLVAANEAFCQLVGVSDPQGRHLSEWAPGLLKRDPDVLEVFSRVAAEGTPETREGYYHPLDKWFEGHVSRIREDLLFAQITDATERRQAERTWQRAQYSLDQMRDYLLWLDSNGRIVEAGEATCRSLEYARDELLGMTLFDIAPQESPKKWPKEWRQTRDEGSRLFEVELRTRTGHVLPVEVMASRMRFEDHEYDCCLCRDISERRLLEQSLRLTQFSVDNAPDIIFWLASDGRIVFANRALCQLLGYAPDEIKSMHVWDIDPSISAGSWPQVWERVGASDGILHEEVFIGKDGKEHAAEILSSHVKYGGNEYGVAVARDVTERKRTEQSLLLTQSTVDNAPDAIFWLTADGHIVFANRACCELLDYTPEEIESMHIWDIDPSLSPESWGQEWDRVRTQGSLLHEEIFLGKDGKEHAVEISSNHVEYGGEQYGVTVARDISERKRAEQALRDSAEQLRQSQKMEAVGRLAGGIAHDFNNVLTTIIGYSDLILSSSECPEGSLAEDVNEIKAAAERASGLTSRILAFSRRQALQPTVLSLNTIVSDTERLLARTIGADIELRTSLSPNLGQVEVDEHQFVQVLLNLAVNARDAMPKGGVLTLETADVELDRRFCETHPDAHPGQYVMLSMTDTGTGMDEDTLAHVFEPFYTTKPPGEGTGLGLSTAYGLIAQSGGVTHVHSRPGEGTTFTIYLPRVAVQATSKLTGAETRSAGQRRTVLLVESDTASLTLTTRILERRGYDVHPARDGEQALVTLGDPSIGIDLLLTDLVLPGPVQGDELARLALAKHTELPVLFMSAHDRDRMIRDDRVDEGVGYLEKPFTADELSTQVRKCLGDEHPGDG